MKRNAPTITLLLCFIFISSQDISAQEILVKDINTSHSGLWDETDRAEMFQCGEYMYFTVRDELGSELWKSNGTTDGTVRVIDLNKGRKDGVRFTQYSRGCLNDALFFAGNDYEHGLEVFTINGTSNSPTLLNDLNIGLDSSSPSNFIDFDGKMYFTIIDSKNNNTVLYQSDGTSEGTIKLKDIATLENEVVWETRIKTNQYVCFITVIRDPVSRIILSSKIWSSDGTTDGTIVIKEFQGLIREPTTAGNKFFFGAYNENNLYELWVSDGTTNGTVVVNSDGHDLSNFIPSNDKIFFNHFTSTSSFTSTDVWVSDGTPEGTLPVYDNTWIQAGATHNNLFYGIGSDFNFQPNVQLFKSDGTKEGTEFIAWTSGINDYQTILPIVNNKLILPFTSQQLGQEPAIYDISTSSLDVLYDVSPGTYGSYPNGFTSYKQNFFFSATDGVHGMEFRSSDGTSQGTKLLKDIKPGTSDSEVRPNENRFYIFKNELYFEATKSSSNDTQLWKTDGTESGTIATTNFESYPTIAGNTSSSFIIFSGEKLFKTDGTIQGTSILKNVPKASYWGYEQKNYNVNNNVLFTMGTGINWLGDTPTGLECWISDGTSGGTHILKDINPGVSDGVTHLTGVELSDQFIFSANDGTNGEELWVTDGTDKGTLLLRDIKTGDEGSSPDNFAKLNGQALFVADDGSHGKELWKSDGTLNGTMLVKDMVSGALGSKPSQLTIVGDHIFFNATDDANNTSLWITDGTEAGTVMVKDINPGQDDRLSNLAEIDGKLYFSASDGAHGEELWISDGTASGTHMIDIVPGESGSTPTLFTMANTHVYFEADNALYITDGTAESTHMVSLLEPQKIIFHNSWIYFGANSRDYGYELFKVEVDAQVKVTGIESLQSGFVIYPNPAQEKIRFQLNNISGPGLLEISDITGRVLTTISTEGNSFVEHDVHMYKPAIYFVKLKTSKGVQTKKFVKD